MKAAIYARVSTETQEKDQTIASQVAELKQYASNNSMVIIDEYLDDGYSGELLERPGLDRLRDDAKNKLFDAVLVHSPDRLSRNFIYSGLVREELKKCNIAIIFLNRPDAKDTPEDVLLEDIQGVIAQYEKAKILERTRRGKIHKAKSGRIIGNTPPYGYQYVDGRYRVDPTEADVVRLIFNLFVVDRMKIRAIAKELVARNIPTKNGNAWRASTVHKMLHNETYIGITHYNKRKAVEIDNPKGYRKTKNTTRRTRPKEEWIPIVLPECQIVGKGTFDEAQELLRRNLTDYNKGSSKYPYLLKGLLSCGVCGLAFCGSKMGEWVYYRCVSHHQTPRRCDTRRVRANVLEPLVWNKLCEIIQQPALMLIAHKWDDFEEKARAREAEEAIKSIEARLRKVEKQADKAYDAYTKDLVSDDEFRDKKTELNNERRSLEAELKKLIDMRDQAALNEQAIKTITEYCQEIANNLQGMSDDFEAKRHLLTSLIEKIEVFPDQIKIYTMIPFGEHSCPYSQNGLI
jgi:site-specific DNA recombinase